MIHNVPYWRLSGFYFFYFAFVGIMSPYWGLYLKSLGFVSTQIAILISLSTVMRMFAPTLWGWLADKRGKRVDIVQLSAFLALLFFLGVFIDSHFAWLFVVLALMSFFWSASLPLVEALTLSHLKDAAHHYGRVRLWGSVGFIFMVVGLGYWLDHHPVGTIPLFVLGSLAGLLLLSRHIPEGQVAPHSHEQGSIWHVLRQPEVLGLIIACFLMSAAHGPYYTFYSIYLVDHGYSKSHVGWLWAIGVVSEIVVFLFAPHLFKRFSAAAVLLVSLALAAVRFTIIAWGVDVALLMVLAQVLHAATFGAFHASAVSLVHQHFRGRHQSKGQALYSSVAFGAGGTFGGLVSGYMWDKAGASWTFTGSALSAALGVLVFALTLRRKENADPSRSPD